MRLTSSRNSLWRRVNNKSKVTVSKNERMKAFQCKLKRSEVESTSFVFHQIRGRIFAQSLKRICTLRPPTHLARSEQQRSIEDIWTYFQISSRALSALTKSTILIERTGVHIHKLGVTQPLLKCKNLRSSGPTTFFSIAIFPQITLLLVKSRNLS